MDDATAARIQYASLLLARYTAEGNVSDLVHAWTLWEKALPGLDGDPALPACLTKYASVLYERFKVTREAGLLQLAVSRQEEALALAAADDPDLCLMQVSLAVMLSGHLTGSAGSGKLDQAVALVLAAEPAAARHGSRLMLTAYMASVLLSQQGADAHLGAVERMTRAALRDAPPGAPECAKLHLLLGRALHRRYARHGDPADLDAVLITAASALHAAPPQGPIRVDALQLLAVGRQLRWRRSGAVADLTAAIELRREASGSGPSPEMLPDLYTGLCSALRDRFERHGDLADLNAALAAGRAALHACAHRPASRARCLANLSSAYRTRFERARKPRDLARAVRMARAAVEQAAPDDKDRPRLLGTLTLALLRDFGYTRQPGRADEAIEVSRSAAAVTPPGHPLRPLLLGNTANALRARYEWTGDLADLNEAVALADEAVEITSPGDPARPRRQAALGTALLRRFESTGRRPDADRAVRILTAAGAASPEDHPERPGLQADLAIVLFRRFETNEDPADLQACLQAGLDAVRATPDDDSDHFRRLSQLAAPLRARYLITGAEPDLEAAIAAARSAARALDDGDSHFNLAMALRLRHERDQLANTAQPTGPVYVAGAGDDRAAAEASFARCARSAATAPLIRAAAAVYCAQLNAEAGDWAAADAAYTQALELLPMLTGRQFGWDSRHRQLARLASLGTDAAAVAVRLGDRQRAVLILEQARGILIGQALEQHRDVKELHRVAPGLAVEFSRLAVLLAADTAASSEFDADPAVLADPAAARRETVARWDDLIATIRRTVPGHQRFLAAPQYGDLLTAAAEGPVVIVNVSRYRCDALIVRPAGIELCPLPGLTSAEATRQAERFLAATSAGGEPAEALPPMLDWLWTALSAPVLRALGPAPARLWWMPTGPLTVLPLHAAASRDPASPDRPSPAVFDLVVSSYTTTLRTLIDARSAGLAPPGGDALVVAMTQTASAAPLPRAAAEAAAVTPLLGGQVTTLTDDSATPAAVRAALRQATRTHLACHAVADLAQDFYQSISHGHPPAVALHHAVRALRQRYPQSPALWGAYVHIGP